MTEHNQPARSSRYKDKTAVNVVLSDKQLDRLQQEARRLDVSRSALLRIIISEWLESRSN